MSEKMTFKELFQHLEEFVQDPERRWHYVMRVKRHLPDPNDLGGLGKDQCYLEGIYHNQEFHSTRVLVKKLLSCTHPHLFNEFKI